MFMDLGGTWTYVLFCVAFQDLARAVHGKDSTSIGPYRKGKFAVVR